MVGSKPFARREEESASSKDTTCIDEVRYVERNLLTLQYTTCHVEHVPTIRKLSHTCFAYQKITPSRRLYCEILSKLRITAKPVRSNIVNRRKRIKVTVRVPHILHRTADS